MIAFTGPYSDVNFGDYAMLVNNIYELEAESATIFVYDRPFIERVREHYFEDRDIRVVEVDLDKSQLPDNLDCSFLTPLELVRAVANVAEIRAALEGVETLYVNGGGYYNSLWSMPHRIERLLQILAPAVVADTMGIPVVFTANGYGPFRGDLEFFSSVFGSLRDARFGVRDRILSPRWLSQLGIAAERIHPLPDDLLLIDERITSRDAVAPEGKYIVMETYLPVSYIEENLDAFTAFANRINADHGLRVVFVPFNLGPAGVEQGALLAQHSEHYELFDITSRGFLSIEDAVALVRGAELVISSRYHAEILALGVGVPFVSVLKDVLGDKQYYYGKNVGALDRVLDGEAHDQRDYFHTDYLAALSTIAEDFEGITARQRAAHERAFARTGERLRAARADYLNGDAHNG